MAYDSTTTPPEAGQPSSSGLGGGRRQLTRILAWTVSFALAGVLLYLSLRGIDWRRVMEVAARANFALLGVFAFLYSTNLLLRALRWRILLSAEGPVGAADAFWSTAAGYFGNNFLPARAGELIRTVMIHSRTGLSKTYVLTTALSERFADAIALVLISTSLLPFVPGRPAWLAAASRTIAIIAGAAALAIAFLPRMNAFGQGLVARLPVPERIRERLSHLLEHVLMGLRAFHSTRRLWSFLAFTLVIWVIDAVNYWVLCRSLGLVLTLPVAFLLIAGIGLGSALPSTPGYVGIYQFVAVTVLEPFGIGRSDAIASILVFQVLGYVLIGFWGATGFVQYRRLPARVRSAEPAAS